MTDEIDEYLQRHPDASPAEIAGALMLSPAEVREKMDVDASTPTPDATETAPQTVEEHYAADATAAVYDALGEIDGSFCPASYDFYGWYTDRPARGAADGEGRAWALGREFERLHEELDRVLYATVNYVPTDWYLDAWTTFEYADGSREWHGEKPMPGYGDIDAYAIFADIDLADGVKEQRPTGDLPQAALEAAIGEYIDAFAELAGGREHVFTLDSVGGVYAFVAPTATTPIAERYNTRDRALLFEDLVDRVNAWLADVNDRVHNAEPTVSDVFKADLVNNVNRLYKAPLSVHKDLDGVVTPIDTDTPDYSFTPLSAVTDAHRTAAREWAVNYTADHTDAVSSVVRTLYDDLDGDWRERLDSRLETLKAAEAKQQQRDAEKAHKTALGADGVDGIDPSDVDVTDDIDIVYAAIDRLDAQRVARKTIVSSWNDDVSTSDGFRAFYPTWGRNSNGRANIVDSEKWLDTASNGRDGVKSAGGPVVMAAIDANILSPNGAHPSDLRSDDGVSHDWWQAVNHLRDLGFEIPYYEGDDGTHPDVMRLYEEPEDTDDQRRKAMLALEMMD